MEVAYTIGGGGLHIKKYRTDNDGGDFIAGIPVMSDETTAASQGVRQATTTTATPFMGITLDAIADSTAAQVALGGGALGNGDNATHVSLVINPDAVFRARLNDGATEDTALAISVVAAQDTAGLDISSTPAVADNATVWGYNTNANNGIVRQTSAADTVVVAFPRDIEASDELLFTEHCPGWTEASPTLTTLLTQVDANTAGTTTKNFVIVEFELKDITDDGRNNSYMLMVGYDHAFAASQLA